MRRGAAPRRRERQPGGDRERVPQRRVERRQRHAHDARDADQRKAPLQRRAERNRRNGLAFHHRNGIVQDLRHRPGAAVPIGEEIGPAGDALFRVDVDQEERCGADRRGAGAERVAHRHLDRRRANAADGEVCHPQAAFRPSAWSARMSATARLSGVGTPTFAPSSATPPESHGTSSRLPRSKS